MVEVGAKAGCGVYVECAELEAGVGVDVGVRVGPVVGKEEGVELGDESGVGGDDVGGWEVGDALAVEDEETSGNGVSTGVEEGTEHPAKHINTTATTA